MYQCKHFKIQELVDRKTWGDLGDTAWQLFDPLILEALDGVRDFFGVPVTGNNWHIGGSFQFRGFRPLDCEVGAKGSQHKLGKAIDFTVKDRPSDEVRKVILAMKDDPLLWHIYRMEDEVSWIHIDRGVIPEGHKRIYLFKA